MAHSQSTEQIRRRKMSKIPVVLMILDGYGLNERTEGNAIALAKTPVMDELMADYPFVKGYASGLAVGLPDGQMGNSEVGHLNMGAGRIVYQDLTRITKEIEDGDFFENAELKRAMENAKENNTALHMYGLLSDGGVHSHINHIFAILDMAKMRGLEKVYVHCFLDGRDVPPRSAAEYVTKMRDKCASLGNAEIATIQGRFYGMDRDKRWDRVEAGYNAIVCGEGIMNPDPVKAVEDSYEANVSDEFVKPVVVCPEGVINEGDSVIFMNFRPDRAREMTWALTLPEFDGFERKKTVFPLSYVCTAQYDETLTLPIAYPPEKLDSTIGEIVSEKGFKQFRVAETEKYAHVTFFFNGGVEKPCEGEERCLVPSPKKFPTYDLIPEMSAAEVADKCVEAIKSDKYEMIVCNFANCDMVGHTGVFDAAVKAVEAVDACVGRLVDLVASKGGVTLITADHGNADRMIGDDGKPFTPHTTNPVPFVVVGYPCKLREGGKLGDIAPTMLEIMHLPQPPQMTGKSLIEK